MDASYELGATGSAVRDKSYSFALRVIGLTRELRRDNEYEVASQFLRSGTSIGANIEEAQAGTSRRDFFAKMSIAAKEARETHYWLSLLRDSGLQPAHAIAPMIADIRELIRLLTAIVKTGTREHADS